MSYRKIIIKYKEVIKLSLRVDRTISDSSLLGIYCNFFHYCCNVSRDWFVLDPVVKATKPNTWIIQYERCRCLSSIYCNRYASLAVLFYSYQLRLLKPNSLGSYGLLIHLFWILGFSIKRVELSDGYTETAMIEILANSITAFVAHVQFFLKIFEATFLCRGLFCKRWLIQNKTGDWFLHDHTISWLVFLQSYFWAKSSQVK